MKEATHTRRGQTIIELGGGPIPCKSINEAKRTSRKIQMDSDKALGRGSLRRLSRKYSERVKTNDRQLSPKSN